MFRRHPLLSLATFAYLGFVAWMTLGPQPLDAGNSSLLWRALAVFSRYEETDWITYQRVEFTANVGMFIPIGMFFLLLFGRRLWLLAIAAGVLLTCSIEFVQMFLPTRVSDVSDIIANSAGTVVGVVFVLIVTTPAARRARRAEAGRLAARAAARPETRARSRV
ncbi:VanZ family protein [Marisediminicola sp. LYQ134]|uniref:VanZ family protein n=1 Tax=unclassified Marisediminicola TaxID=2618316 RepID=UPI00398358B5